MRQVARAAIAREPSIMAVLLFGSRARDDWDLHSDADLLVILRDSPYERRADRIPHLSGCFASSPYPVEIVPVTVDELVSELRQGSAFFVRAIREGVRLDDGPEPVPGA